MKEDNNYSELIAYLDEKFQANEKAHHELREMFSNLQSTVDAYAKRADAYFQEMLVLSHQVDRLEKWVKQIADKLGMKLEM